MSSKIEVSCSDCNVSVLRDGTVVISPTKSPTIKSTILYNPDPAGIVPKSINEAIIKAYGGKDGLL